MVFVQKNDFCHVNKWTLIKFNFLKALCTYLVKFMVTTINVVFGLILCICNFRNTQDKIILYLTSCTPRFHSAMIKSRRMCYVCVVFVWYICYQLKFTQKRFRQFLKGVSQTTPVLRQTKHSVHHPKHCPESFAPTETRHFRQQRGGVHIGTGLWHRDNFREKMDRYFKTGGN